MEPKRISVIVFKPAGRAFFQAQWRDPVTGKKRKQSTRTKIRREAERIAGDVEKRLNDGTYRAPRTVLWADFRARYERDKVPGLAPKTALKIRTTFRAVETFIAPQYLAAVREEQIAELVAAMRKKGLSENTIKSTLSHLRASLFWAKRQKLLAAVPDFEMPTRTKGARHRSITGEEFDRIIAAVPVVVESAPASAFRLVTKEQAIDSWTFLLRGLWWSGLRLGEALNLTWDDDRRLRVKLSGRFPMLWIPAELQKNHKNETVPLAPEFVEHLRSVPETQRTGHVFHPLRLDGHNHEREGARSGRLKPNRVGKTIADFGETAKVIVNRGEAGEPAEYASAHDCRRAFGFRWSERVMPAVLKVMMRHSSILTTMTYYAVGTAEATAATIWSSQRSEGAAKAGVGAGLAPTSLSDVCPAEIVAHNSR